MPTATCPCAATKTRARASSFTPRSSGFSAPASTRIPSSTNTVIARRCTNCPLTAGPASRITSASGLSTRPMNTSAAAPRGLTWSATWAATMLDYWTSGHYAGGAECNIPAGEGWNKVVGPIFCYCNALRERPRPPRSPNWTLAGHGGQSHRSRPAGRPTRTPCSTTPSTEAKTIKAQWPYTWVQGVGLSAERPGGPPSPASWC